ncbi:MAG: gamma-glutamyl-gamma-aminobutyrate hydrolase family protein [Dehalococcoidia bacterium]
MALIAVTASSQGEAAPYVESIHARAGDARVVVPDEFSGVDGAMDGVSGLLLCGGYDIDPSYYGEEDGPAAKSHYPERDEMELAMVRYAVERDMPVLAICRGMQLLNVAFGGKLVQDMPNHRGTDEEPSITHPVFVSPGSKLGALLGAGAIYRTNSLHHQGVVEANRAASLLASAYHPDDGVIEGLESPEHKWLFGVQCHIELESEVPRSFLGLWEWLVGWAERYEEGDMG